jgi:hypothetical protein
MKPEEALSAAQVLVLRGLAAGKKLDAIADDMPSHLRIGRHGVRFTTNCA